VGVAVALVIVIESASSSTTDEDKQLLCKLALCELYICVHLQRCFSWGVVLAIKIFLAAALQHSPPIYKGGSKG